MSKAEKWFTELKAVVNRMPADVELLVHTNGRFLMAKTGSMRKAMDAGDAEYNSVEWEDTFQAKCGERIDGSDRHF
ncbi:hypothetical protein SAMN02744133_108191 [Thalassospira xiamenensis M-5 = DSM 17429]|nr:hypothetical protein [Thalassospira xiamenensis]SIT22361.1 hypothetical protein SAMN02744133_108191 [Thalassospira xiamenensis M-5 = DSM 17429]